MAEQIRTDAERQARRELLKDVGVANSELLSTIPERCSGCGEAIIRAFSLAGMVAKKELTMEDAKANFSNDTGECEGTVSQPEVHDGRPLCWRKQQLGRVGILRGRSAFTD